MLFGSETFFDSGEFSWRRKIASTISTAVERNSLCQFWNDSNQNWQSEFLSTDVLIVLAIFLRQENSPESKKVSDPNSKTGTS